MVFKYSYTVSTKESCKSASLKKSKSKAINSDDDNGIFILRKNNFFEGFTYLSRGDGKSSCV